MENKTAEEIISKYEESICDFNGNQFAIIRPLNAKLAMEEYASQQLSEKDKEIERLKRRKLVHQLFIGKVADILSVEKVQELLRESHESLNK